MSILRNEYPRPQFRRSNWLCLNGMWSFEFDPSDSGKDKEFIEKDFSNEIAVPFCPESSLSGIGKTDFHNSVWYRRKVQIPLDWKGDQILLHFQAVDYDTTVWINSKEMCRHRGGFTPFSVELPLDVTGGDIIDVVVRARDNHRHIKPQGKQSSLHELKGCYYTRTTGIWQSVWMEPVSRKAYLLRPKITPNLSKQEFHISAPIHGERSDLSVKVSLYDEKGMIDNDFVQIKDFQPALVVKIPSERLKLWDIGEGNLYDIKIELMDCDGQILDSAKCYAGMRSVTIDGKAVKINGRVVFQKLVLDQGYYPDGIMTAPTDEVLEQDIKLSLEAGFIGARLHQKVFEERFLYHADRLGYIVWEEFADWGWDIYMQKNYEHCQPNQTWITQWLEVLERDYNHPCIVGWCPMNESAAPLEDTISALDDVIKGMFLATKAFDQSRPVLDSSGYSHRMKYSDVWDCHDYSQNPEKLRENHALISQGKVFRNDHDQNSKWDIEYSGQPFFNSEFGGIWWQGGNSQGEEPRSWGYGERPVSIEEFYKRFEELCGVLLENPDMFGYCYTQLTDVYQEQNGIYNFDRSIKFDMDRIYTAQQKTPAIEQVFSEPENYKVEAEELVLEDDNLHVKI